VILLVSKVLVVFDIRDDAADNRSLRGFEPDGLYAFDAEQRTGFSLVFHLPDWPKRKNADLWLRRLQASDADFEADERCAVDGLFDELCALRFAGGLDGLRFVLRDCDCCNEQYSTDSEQELQRF
jgi:hypothetical protein